MPTYDAVVIGGGFFGATLSSHLASSVGTVLLVERESELLRRASYVNQARVHHGYHYPRSILTAYRSRLNFERFVRDYEEAVDRSFTQVYAIGRLGSKVSPNQFNEFCRRVGIPAKPASPPIMKLMNPDLIQAAFEVREYAFNADRLRDLAWQRLRRAGVETLLSSEALRVEPLADGTDGMHVMLRREDSDEEKVLKARYVFISSYSTINRLLQASNLAPIPLKHELVEISLVEPPEALRGVGITVMDGPFFGTMPFPARDLHSLYHVRYAPHYSWQEGPSPMGIPSGIQFDTIEGQVKGRTRRSRFGHVIRDAQRYIPSLRHARKVESLWEIRTILPQSETDDSRPILFRKHQGLKNLFCVCGAKVDNVYDLIDVLNRIDLS